MSDTATTLDYTDFFTVFSDPIGYYRYQWTTQFWDNLWQNLLWPYTWMKQLVLFFPNWATFFLFYILVPFVLINMFIMLVDGDPVWSFLWADGDVSLIDFWIDIQSWYVWLVQKSVIGINKKAFDVTK